MDRITRQAVVKNDIRNNTLLSVTNLTAALNISEGIITEEVLVLCHNVKTIELGLPVPNTPNVAIFSEQIGSENSTQVVTTFIALQILL